MRQKKIKRIAISTGGGDAPGLNAVIRAVVKTAIRQYGWEVLGIQDGFDGLFRKDGIMALTVHSVRGILPKGGTILGTTNRGNPFKWPVKRGGKIFYQDRTRKFLKELHKLDIQGLVTIGGDGTLTIAKRLMELDIPVVGVPKTIDNDLNSTDLTFGFLTAVQTATEAIDKLHTTAESHHRVMVVEVMGREAGWIALEAGIAGGADIILIPEIPFSINKVLKKIKDRNKKGSKFSIVVVAEGAYPKGGQQSYISQRAGKRLGGIGQWVADKISDMIPVETRVTVLGHLQRGGTPVAFDRVLGTRLGVAATELINDRQFGYMVALKGTKIVKVPIEEAVNNLKLVDPKGQMVKAAEQMGISLGR